jgi:hypothetical protein
VSAAQTQTDRIEENDPGIAYFFVVFVILLGAAPVLAVVVPFLFLGGILSRESIFNPLHDLRKKLARAQQRRENNLLIGVARVIVSQADIAALRGAARAHGQRGAKPVAPPAAGLLAIATLLLPHAARIRYAEELRTELWEIARVGGGRRPQLGYAARQVIAAPRLRAGLRPLGGAARCHDPGGDGGA